MRAIFGAALMCGASLAALPAMAGSPTLGGCEFGGPCAPDVVVLDHQRPYFDDMIVSVDQPLGHLRTVDFRRSPHVSVTRIHSQGGMAALDDKPIGFDGGCHPESTAYCGADGHIAPPPPPVIAEPLPPAPLPLPVPVAPPVVNCGVVQAPPPCAAPVPVAAPIPAPVQLRTWTASYNDDPSRFIPRQYGSLDFVPGIAHVPSSWVDRDPARAQAALDASGVGGIAPGPQVGLVRIPDDTPGPIIPPGQFQGPGPVQPGSIVQPGPASHAPNVHVVTRHFEVGAPAVPVMANVNPAPVMAPLPVMAPAPVMGPVAPVQGMAPSGTVVPNLAPAYPHQPPAPVLTESGHYASGVAADGTYWEKVSGPTMMGDTLATQVICKRRLETEVVNPVVGVPTPVCGPEPHAAHPEHVMAPAPLPAPVPAPMAPPPLHTQGLAGGHWTH